MTDHDGVPGPGQLARRNFLGLGAGALAGAAAGATLLGDTLPAGAQTADPPTPEPGSNAAGATSGEVSASSVPVPTPGLSYYTVSGYALQVDGDPASDIKDVSPTGAGPRPNGAFCHANFNLPGSGVVRELHVWGTGSTSVTLLMARADVYLWSTIDGATTAAGGGLQYGANTALNYGLYSFSSLMLRASLTNTQTINAVSVGWAPYATMFVPVSPFRAYDSRLSGGPMNGGTRTVSVKDARNVDTGAVTATNVVPTEATGVAFNVTVVNTVGAGYIWVAPGGTATLAASTINWFNSGQVLANAAQVGVDTNRQVKVFCSGQTDFIIDILGYYTQGI